jgi:hypothetical protein
MKIISLLFGVMLLSCGLEENSAFEDQSKKTEKNQTNQIQICHNPESSNHRQVCNSKCFEPNLGSSSFCWTLKKSDCLGAQDYDWQRENCHFFD